MRGCKRLDKLFVLHFVICACTVSWLYALLKKSLSHSSTKLDCVILKLAVEQILTIIGIWKNTIQNHTYDVFFRPIQFGSIPTWNRACIKKIRNNISIPGFDFIRFTI